MTKVYLVFSIKFLASILIEMLVSSLSGKSKENNNA